MYHSIVLDVYVLESLTAGLIKTSGDQPVSESNDRSEFAYDDEM